MPAISHFEVKSNDLINFVPPVVSPGCNLPGDNIEDYGQLSLNRSYVANYIMLLRRIEKETHLFGVYLCTSLSHTGLSTVARKK